VTQQHLKTANGQAKLADKAGTLSGLAGRTRHSLIGEQLCVTRHDWHADPDACLSSIRQVFPKGLLMVRSNHSQEDQAGHSQAGRFLSIPRVEASCSRSLQQAIDRVFASYPPAASGTAEQVLLQPYLTEHRLVGVMFTRSLETGAPYDQLNYQLNPAHTDAVTAGTGDQLCHHTLLKNNPEALAALPKGLRLVVQAARELETLLGCDELDIEFAVDHQYRCHVFQVRRLPLAARICETEPQVLQAKLKGLARRCFAPQPAAGVVGRQRMYGLMPDWNPAEIIGTRPRPLALSLYRHVLVDDVWAQQRAEYGYRDMRGHRLVTSMAGMPYVDVRLSLNSFIPATVSAAGAERLVEAGLTHLRRYPEWHDKVEFEVAISALTPGFAAAVKDRLLPYGVSLKDINELHSGLLTITAQALLRLADDTRDLDRLAVCRADIMAADSSALVKGLALLDSVKPGTLAFAHAARAAFVAVAMLNDMVTGGLLSDHEKQRFMQSVSTVSSAFQAALHNGSEAELLNTFGHLRPGTYDITSQAYREDPDRYFQRQKPGSPAQPAAPFTLSAVARQATDHWLQETFAETPAAALRADDLFDFFRQAIVLREHIKLEFTRHISLALDCFVDYGRTCQLSREQLSYLTLEDMRWLANHPAARRELDGRIQDQQRAHQLTQSIELPHLISAETDFLGFQVMRFKANFITRQSITAPTLKHWHDPQQLAGCVVLLEQADPGYDWIFSQPIAGFITAYGGANSHLAIRAAELGIPACIGVGPVVFEWLGQVPVIQLNCQTEQLNPLQP